jgi:hypothetical protein
MKVSCNEGVASHVGPESCVTIREVVIEALTGESAGRVLSLENPYLSGSADAVMSRRKATADAPTSRGTSALRVVADPARTEASQAEPLRRELRNGSREISGSTRGNGG